MRYWHILIGLSTLTGLSDLALADVFYLANGGTVEGVLLNPDEAPRERYHLKTPLGAELSLDASQVERVLVRTELERRYEQFLAKLPDTAEAHREMAERCRIAKLEEARLFHLEQVLRHEPDDEAARHALGYSRVDGRWVHQDVWMEEQGYVRHGGRWLLPQEIALQRASDEREDQIVEWRKQLKTWRGWIVKGRDNAAAGEQLIRDVHDPMAVSALADMLKDDREHRALKLLYIEVLGQIQSPAAAAVLAQHALHNADGKLRDACLDQLESMESAAAVQTFASALGHKENHVVRRAGLALGRMKDPSPTLDLINALITEHKQVIGGSGGISPTFSNQGGGLSVGGKPKVEKVKLKNETVLHALTALNTGVNFGYNQAAWKAWYISERTPPPIDLRRER